jgi:1-acyl-sn-glycerol-3-phosphate acyltransferase
MHPLATIIAAMARAISGVQVRWVGCLPAAQQRIYFANHTSHLDFVVLWSALPPDVRAKTRPVAAKDYWESSRVRRYLATKVFRAVLIQRGAMAQARNQEEAQRIGQALVEELSEALGETNSLIVFPEGTRGTGETIGPFRAGLYYLARHRPDVELVPAYLENLNRILPKGEVLPVPLISLLTFGVPIRLRENEGKALFLERARTAVCGLREKGRA